MTTLPVQSNIFTAQPVGKCKHCGCTPEHPCRLYSNDECVWRNEVQDVCSNPKCYYAEERAKKEFVRRRDRDLAAAGLPIAQRWAQTRKRDRDARRKQSKRMAKRREKAA